MSILLRISQQIGTRGRLQFLPSHYQKLPSIINLKHLRPISTTIPARLNFKAGSGLFEGQKSIEKLRKKDGIPKSYTLIYRSNYQNYLYIIQGVVGCMFVVSLAMIVDALYTTFSSKELKPKETSEEKRQRLLIEYKDDMKSLQEMKQAVADKLYDGQLERETSSPNLTDILSEEYDYSELAMLFLIQIGFIIALIKFLKLLPVRLYTNNRGHVIRIHHSALVPFLRTRPEMVAGTLKAVARPISENEPQSLMEKLSFKNATFKLPNGESMLLFEHFFRTPADLNKLLGIYSEDDLFDQEEEEIPRAFEKD